MRADENGRTIEDRIWVPTQISPAVGVFLVSLACELGRVTQSRDCLEVGPNGEPLLESFRLSLLGQARAEVEAAYAGLRAQTFCESALLQGLLDVLFLRQWLDSQPGPHSPLTTWLSPALNALLSRIDPINYETYEPRLEEAVAAYGISCSLILSHLCQPSGTNAALGGSSLSFSRSISISRRSGPTSSEDAPALNSMPLVPPVPRFTLLPVVMEPTTPASTRLSPTRDHSGKARHNAAASASSFSFGGFESGGPGAKGAAQAVGNAANVLSSFSLSALGNTAASKASSFLRGTAKR